MEQLTFKERAELARDGYPCTEEGKCRRARDYAAAALRNEEAELIKWFAEYDRITVEHGRCQRIGITCAHDIAALDAEAETKKARINEIRNELGGSNNGQ